MEWKLRFRYIAKAHMTQCSNLSYSHQTYNSTYDVGPVAAAATSSAPTRSLTPENRSFSVNGNLDV